MTRTFLLAITASLLAGCAPQTTIGAAATAPGGADSSACAARGGTMKQVGRMQSWQCVVSFADAGRSCVDGDQCQGDCRVDGNSGIAPGAAAVGVCQATSDSFGCHTRIEDGAAGSTLCID
jgi:hypothetical protein